MTRIITTHYRYKPPPKKRKAVPLAGPAVVTPKRKQAVPLTVEPIPSRPAIVRKTKPCNDNRSEASSTAVDDPPKSAIVTARRPGRPDVPDLTPEEHQRRGDAAAADAPRRGDRVRRQQGDVMEADAIGEALGVISKAKALVGRDIDDAKSRT